MSIMHLRRKEKLIDYSAHFPIVELGFDILCNSAGTKYSEVDCRDT